jgi:ribosomal protein S18 acetylase RimI-like enzyme
MRLTAASAVDAQAMTGVFLDARRDATPYLPQLHSDSEVLRWMANVVIRESRVILAVSSEGTVAGFAALGPGHLDHLYVAPKLQGQGVGASLLAAAKAASPQGLRLHVFQRNDRARAFYARRGFRLDASRDGSQNEENEPDAVYIWEP